MIQTANSLSKLASELRKNEEALKAQAENLSLEERLELLVEFYESLSIEDKQAVMTRLGGRSIAAVG